MGKRKGTIFLHVTVAFEQTWRMLGSEGRVVLVEGMVWSVGGSSRKSALRKPSRWGGRVPGNQVREVTACWPCWGLLEFPIQMPNEMCSHFGFLKVFPTPLPSTLISMCTSTIKPLVFSCLPTPVKHRQVGCGWEVLIKDCVHKTTWGLKPEAFAHASSNSQCVCFLQMENTLEMGLIFNPNWK